MIKKDSVSIKIEVDATEIKEAFKLIAQLKSEVLELEKLGVSFTLKDSKTILHKK